jgi:hypothetical protein
MVCQPPSVKRRRGFLTTFFRRKLPMDNLRFHCVICGNVLEIASGLASGVMECPTCLRVVPIPAPLSFPREKVRCLPVLPPDILAVDIKILCGKCFSKIRLDARLEGTRVTCPICAADVPVPMWSLLPPESPGSRVSPLSAEEIEFLSASVEPIAGGASGV